MIYLRLTIALVLSCFCSTVAATGKPFVVHPLQIQLTGNFEVVQLVVTDAINAEAINDRSDDLTTIASYGSSDPNVARVDQAGRVWAVGNGEAQIAATIGNVSSIVPVVVSDVLATAKPDFAVHIQPILSKQGCAAAACHASQHGKGGFKLSVFGFDPPADHRAIVRDRIGRRVNQLDPPSSLLLQKPTLKVSHGGGQRLVKGTNEYTILAAWIRSGSPGPVKEAPEVSQLVVTPTRRVGQVGTTQQLRVEAHYNNGLIRDVTRIAKFDSIDTSLLTVSNEGHVTVEGRGQSPIMIRFAGQAAIAMFVIPAADSIALNDWSNNNFIDEHAAAKFRELGIEPSEICDDTTFVRRAFFDAIGGLPTPEETQSFLQSTNPNKREDLVNRLLGLTGDSQLDIYNDRYAAFWTLKWSDLLRNSSDDLGEQGMWSLHNWIKDSFRTNKPFTQFVQELVTAKGSIYFNGPANYFRINTDSSKLTEATAQLFLGVRLECAKCHHHPFEKYSQADYYRLAAFFSRVGTKNSQEFGLFGRESVVVVRDSGDVKHPRSGEVLKPTPLDGAEMENPLDRRIPLAAWLTSPKNEFLGKSIVNRYVGYLLGRGLVEPIDDMRSTNPPSNVALMEALSADFVASGFDLKHLIRTIMTSRLYQLSSQPTEANASDHRFYSHYKVKRLTAEPLLDAVDQVAGTQTKFKSLPLGTRAIELPDAKYPNYFLNTFAKPRRVSICECERSMDANLAQALHTLNGDVLAQKISADNGRISTLLSTDRSHTEMVDAIYMAALCRHATNEEISATIEFLDQSQTPKEYYEDLLWALVNSKQFLYVH